MWNCKNCGTTVVLGGHKGKTGRFCSEKCLHAGDVDWEEYQLSPEEVKQYTQLLREGNCPVCSGPGPVDAYATYRVLSLLVVSTHEQRRRLSCRSCAMKANVASAFFCLLFGWWSFPLGIVLTPVFILLNVHSLLSTPNPDRALERMSDLAKEDLIKRLALAEKDDR